VAFKGAESSVALLHYQGSQLNICVTQVDMFSSIPVHTEPKMCVFTTLFETFFIPINI
jgi:hypothetical protein